MFTIQGFEEKDVDDVLKLAERSLQEGITPEDIVKHSRGPRHVVRVAREIETGDLIGVIAAEQRDGLEGHVNLFAVDPSFQSLGLGRSLLRDAERCLAARNVRSLHLELRYGNDRARHLYEHEGFAVEGVQEQAYRDGEDALLMAKPLR